MQKVLEAFGPVILHGFPLSRTGFSLGTLTQTFDPKVSDPPDTRSLSNSILITALDLTGSAAQIILCGDRCNMEFIVFVLFIRHNG